MSKIGQKPIPVPTSVTVEINDQIVTVKGAKGQMEYTLPKYLTITREDYTLYVQRTGDAKHQKSTHGLYRSLIANAVQGVDQGWSKRLEVVGTGFNVKMQGTGITMKVGFSHTVNYSPSEGIQLATEGNNIIIVSGANKQLVGQTAHQIKALRKPDAYKGKGIRYEGEQVRIKAGKKTK